jgi:hypothetical protein
MAKWKPPESTFGRKSSEIKFSLSPHGNLPLAETLLRWTSFIMDRQPPPIFRLQEPQKDQIPTNIYLGNHNFPSKVSQRPDSGILEFEFAESDRLHDFGPELAIRNLASFAQQEFDRSFYSIEPTASQVILAEMQSLLNLAEHEEQVIGPGGRITVYRGDRGMEADLVVRRRVGEIPSSWRRPELIVSRVQAEIAGQPEGIEVSCQFGYLEVSKYERQEWLRPVFLLSFQNTGALEGQVPWQYGVVEPASTNLELSLEEGLGSWSEMIRNE